MQFFPISNVGLKEESSSTVGSLFNDDSKEQSRAFFDLVQQEIGNKKPSEQVAPNETSANSVKSLKEKGPAGEKSIDQGLDRKKVTREEFADLTESLEKAGVDEKTIKEMEAQVEAGTLTWKKMTKQIADALDMDIPVQLTVNQERHLLSFFQKIGMTPQQAQEMVVQVKSGHMDQVMSEVSMFLSQVKPGEKIPLTRKEMETLVQVLNLSQEKKKQAHTLIRNMQLSGVRGSETGEAQAEHVKMVVNLLRQGMAEKEGGQDHAVNELSGKIARMLEKHRTWTDKAGEEANRVSREGLLQAVKENVQSGRESRTSAGITEETAKKLVGDQPRPASQSGKESRTASVTAEDKGQGITREQANSGKESQVKDDSQGWNRLWDRIKVELEGQGISVAGKPAAHMQPQDAHSRNVTLPRVTQQAIFDQVQSGVFRNLGQGRRQISLHLNPPDLGKVQVLLQVHNKEVQAVISSKSSEVNHAVSQQLAQLREGLEQQGLRVVRLEVQTQAQNQNLAGQWQSPEEHNQAWEKFRKGLWRSKGFNGNGEGGEEAARDVVEDNPKRTGSDGLDIFA